jgi:hypothetical protein
MQGALSPAAARCAGPACTSYEHLRGSSAAHGASRALRAAPRAARPRARRAAAAVARAGGMRDQMAAVKDMRSQMDANPDLATLSASPRRSRARRPPPVSLTAR